MCFPQDPSPVTANAVSDTDVSSSPDRHRWQRQRYIMRQEESGKPMSDDYLQCLDHIIHDHDRRFDPPERRENNMEYDLITCDWILAKARASESYSQNLYAAMCNNEFQRQDIMPILRDQRWHCSWRYAGGIIADMREQGDYIDWYCSGIAGGDEPDVYNQAADLMRKRYVNESVVTDEIRADLGRLGWRVCEDDGD